MNGPIKANLWSYWGNADALCITTNGCVVRGECVMGAGNALEAKQRFPGIALHLGRMIATEGNHTRIVPGTTVPFGTPSALVALPTKLGDTRVTNIADVLPQYQKNIRVGYLVPGWKLMSPLPLIKRSLEELVKLADKEGWQSIILPPPGMGHGGQNLNTILELCNNSLDQRFTMVMK